MSLLEGFLVHESSQLVLCRLLHNFIKKKQKPKNQLAVWVRGKDEIGML